MTAHQDEPLRHRPGMPKAGDAAVPTADAGEASNHLGQNDGADVARHGDGEERNRPSTPGPDELHERGGTEGR